MTTVDICAAQAELPALIERASAGEEVVIVVNGKPAACLVAARAPLEPRRPGRLAGKIWIADDFDAPLPESVLSGFRGEAP